MFMKTSPRIIFLVALAVVILAVDGLTKYWTDANLPLIGHGLQGYPYGGIPIFKDFLGIDFSLNHATNKGAAWGVFSQFQMILLAFRLMLIAALFVFLIKFNQRRSWQIPLVLILAGALGNVIDFFVYGHVVDMLHFVLWGYDFPIFNISDTAIFLGIAALMLLPSKAGEKI